ncbi:hypothetical protein GCWU000282_00062 [Catonella morbi ATCC 51271]|uniref:Uncharacterized protein n=1 Tax=Catonella morbi ATCC 51271 TaxID=592026 RepID=V2ZCM4_9FIRM|nr:hypothetical protein [Catonella morbi]ESL04675.1 hypothetical protein GCWU000282_00062 [Catonella morbi ATCC 51271]
MIQLLLIRDSIKSVFKKYNAAIIPVLRFIAAFVTFALINGDLGYNEKLTGISVLVLLSAISAFFPMGVTVFLSGILMIFHIYSASMFLSLIFIVIIAILYFLLMRLAPGYSSLIIAIPVLTFFHMEALVPIAVGLVGSPIAIFAMIPGIVVSVLFNIIKEAVKMSAGSMQIEDNLQIYVFVIKSLLENKLMLLMIASAIAVFLATYICRRLAVSHSYILGIIAGIIVNLIVMIVGGLVFEVNVSVLWIFLGSIISGALAFAVQFFKYLLDYSSVEHLQFDDDDYFYYVTAVPKLSVTSPDLNILKINGNETGKE